MPPGVQVAILIMAQVALCILCAILNLIWRETEVRTSEPAAHNGQRMHCQAVAERSRPVRTCLTLAHGSKPASAPCYWQACSMCAVTQ
jgi:hypothetical protein